MNPIAQGSGDGGEHRRRVVIALGGNMGDRVETLRRAMLAIDDLDGIELVAASSMYETPALTLDGIDEAAPRFLNAVVIVVSVVGPAVLLGELQAIEDRFGRQRTERWGSRTLDLDIIDIDGVQMASETLELPHPRAWQRAFVLAPWYEIDPAAHLTGHGPIEGLLGMATDRVHVFAEAGLEGRSPHGVSTDRGLPLVGPESMAEGRRPIRGGEGLGFGSGFASRVAAGEPGSEGSSGWRAGNTGPTTTFGADHERRLGAVDGDGDRADAGTDTADTADAGDADASAGPHADADAGADPSATDVGENPSGTNAPGDSPAPDTPAST
ncbi:MAG: 2-amino-4-hydroxy-6-hydroxymethyldihydropteridine diphosphokinase [Pseudoclavibacter sp.]